MSPAISKSDIKICRQWCATLSQCEQEIEKAKLAGLPVEELEQRCANLKQRFAQFVAVYGEDMK